MSAMTESTRTESTPNEPGRRPGSRRPELHAVAPEVAPLRQLPFLLVLAGVLGLGMAGLLVLNTTVQNQSFDLADKRATATRLGYTEAGLQHELDQVSSPRSLALKATALNMRPNAQPAFLVLPDGTVIGSERATDGKDFPSAIVKSQAQLDAERRAAAERKAEEQRKADEKKQAEAQKKADQKKADQNQADQKQDDQKQDDQKQDGGE